MLLSDPSLVDLRGDQSTVNLNPFLSPSIAHSLNKHTLNADHKMDFVLGVGERMVNW